MKVLKNQRDKIVDYMLTGARINRPYCAQNCIALELSSRIGEIQEEYGIEIQRKSIKFGNSRVTEYWIKPDDMEFVRNQFMINVWRDEE